MARPPTPSPIIIPNCLQFAMHWTYSGGAFSNTYHAALTAAGPLNPAFAETLFSALKANGSVAAWLSAHVSSDVSFSGVTCKDMRGANNPTLVSTGTAAPGAAAGTPAPINAALVITHRTAQSGRAFRGRSYLAGLTTADMADKRTWSNAVGVAGIALLNGIDTVAQSNGGGLVIGQVHLLAGTTVNGGVLPDRPAGTVDIVSFDVANPRIDTQRKRLGR